MATSNAIGANTAGIVRYNGTGTFDAVTATNHNLLIGATSNGITNVVPSATSGVPIISQGASSDPAFGTMTVAGGGTGGTSFTAYNILAAGTTSTGAFQNVSGTGTSGQVLTSNGAAALPTWQTAAGFGTNTVSGQLTSAQIKSLMASPIQIVAAPGANKVIYPVYSWARMNYGGTSPFTGAIATINLFWDATGTPTSASYPLMINAPITASVTEIYIRWNIQGAASAAASIINKALFIYNAIADFGGNAANDNTIDYYVVYNTLSI
jgi:hypothetical protein